MLGSDPWTDDRREASSLGKALCCLSVVTNKTINIMRESEFPQNLKNLPDVLRDQVIYLKLITTLEHDVLRLSGNHLTLNQTVFSAYSQQSFKC